MAERPPTRRSDRGSWERGYRNEATFDEGDRDDGAWDAYYRDEGYRDAGSRDAGHRDAGYRDAGSRDAGYRDMGSRDAGYRGRHGGSRAEPPGRPAGDRLDRGGDRRGWDERPPGGRGGLDRDWDSEDSRARAGQSRARWAGEDRRSWDGAWAWDDEDPGEDGYRGGGHEDDSTGGAEGNERLTALTGSVLLVLFAVEGFTVLSVHQLLTLHFFLGMLLIGPVLLKVCSVLYRFVRYYTGAEEYRRKGPPAPLLRLLGPVVMITSLAVLGTGVMLAIVGPRGAGTWLFLHKASFVLWFCAMTVHVLAYVWRLPRLISGDLVTRASYRAQEVLAGRPARFLLLAASLLTGLLLAMATFHRADIWFGAGH
jgi:hypothetical protein